MRPSTPGSSVVLSSLMVGPRVQQGSNQTQAGYEYQQWSHRLRAVHNFQADVKFYLVWWELWTEAVETHKQLLWACVGFNMKSCRWSEQQTVCSVFTCLTYINKWHLPMLESAHVFTGAQIWLIKPSWRFFWLTFVQLLNDLNDFRVISLTSILQRSHVHYV